MAPLQSYVSHLAAFLAETGRHNLVLRAPDFRLLRRCRTIHLPQLSAAALTQLAQSGPLTEAYRPQPMMIIMPKKAVALG